METKSNGALGMAVAVFVSEDRLSAFIQLTEPVQEQSITESELQELLKANGVTYGISQEALMSFAANPSAFAQTPLLVAQGRKPVNGEDGRIQFWTSTETKKQKPLELDDGKVDYRELQELNNVSKGQLIAERILPTEGTPGITVGGEPIPAKSGKNVWFKLGKNVVADPDRLRLYAVIDGLFTKTDKDKLNVFPVYEVNGDVDYRSGNIDFIGNVVVRGNVLSGFKIKAAGDIRITGGVEGAELEANGSIDIAAGIFASLKGFVKAGINVKSSFIQEANVFAGEDVIVSQSILHSNVRAGRSVICSGSKGLIVGGIIQAGEYIVARTAGNSTSTPTSLEVGIAPELRQEYQELRQSVQAMTENNGKTDQALQLLDQMAAAGKLSSDKLALRSKLMAAKRAAMEELAGLKERIIEIELLLDEIQKAKVEVTGTVYPGTKVVIGRYTRFVKDATTRVSFYLENGEISLSSHLTKRTT